MNLVKLSFAVAFMVLVCGAVFGATDNRALVTAARAQIGVTVRYVPSYQKLSYPNGDVPREQGVCVDVVIRAMRDAKRGDLQRLVHEDMKAHFDAYPKNWGLKTTDRNIDHRRVPNLQCFFKRKGWSSPVTKKAADYQPGDFVTCMVAKRLPHIMIVSDRKAADGTPLVIHNIGAGTHEENCLFTYPLTGHYRMGSEKQSEKGQVCIASRGKCEKLCLETIFGHKRG